MLGLAMVIIFAGHGVVPIGLILIFGESFWYTPMFLAWGGLATLVASWFITHRSWHTVVSVAGYGLVVFGLVRFISNSDAIVFSLITSIPFASTVVTGLTIRACFRLISKLHADTCRECGYDLTGNESGVCPECGHESETETAQA